VTRSGLRLNGWRDDLHHLDGGVPQLVAKGESERVEKSCEEC
jgi:hypothetical protein